MRNLKDSPLIFLRCTNCGNKAGWILINKGGDNAQIDLMRMFNDYQCDPLCPDCIEKNCIVNMLPEVNKGFYNVERLRGPMEP
jgi:hypothetical protein